MARVLVVDPHAPDPRVIEEVAALLRDGRLVALPTETVYGLGGRALDPTAIRRIYEAKGRPSSHPLIAHVLGEAEAKGLAAAWPRAASLLAAAFWPGPLTLIVPRAAHVPRELAGGGTTLAVRAPSHPVMRAVLESLGEPIAAPSANAYQGLSPTRADHVVRSLGDRVSLVLDAGPCESGIESTVIDLTDIDLTDIDLTDIDRTADLARPRALRLGAIPLSAIRAIVSLAESPPTVVAGSAPRPSPGMDPKHYAPRTPLSLVPSGALAEAVAKCKQAGRSCGVVVFSTAEPRSRLGAGPVHLLPPDPVLAARALFDTLHALDAAGLSAILVEEPPPGEAWDAVRDRLLRASR